MYSSRCCISTPSTADLAMPKGLAVASVTLAMSTLRGPTRAEVAGFGWIWPGRCSERWFRMGV